MRIELESRGGFYEVQGASVKELSSNAWEVRLPRDDRSVQRSRRAWSVEGWDGAVLALDGVETEPGVASAIDESWVTLNVFAV